MTNSTTYTVTDDNGDEFQIDLPTKFEVCERCEGHGTHLHEAIGGHAYTREEFDESFDDEERAEYFRRGGRYDVTCSECKGLRVVSVIDIDEIEKTGTQEQKDAIRLMDEKRESDAYYEAERRAEMRFGY